MKDWNNLIDKLETKLASMTSKDWEIWKIRRRIKNYQYVRDWAISELLRYQGNKAYISHINEWIKTIERTQLKINQIRQKNWYWEEI